MGTELPELGVERAVIFHHFYLANEMGVQSYAVGTARPRGPQGRGARSPAATVSQARPLTCCFTADVLRDDRVFTATDIYTESSYLYNADHTLRITSRFPAYQTGNYIEFRYHMFGSHMGSLKIQTATGTDPRLVPESAWSTVWSKSGQQHTCSGRRYDQWYSRRCRNAACSGSSTRNCWSLARYNFPAAGTAKVARIVGRTGSGYRSDMAIDLLKVMGVHDPNPDIFDL